MPGDYTRFTFDPAKRFSGVRKQQGRVSLDSDFNEFEEILDRRDRAEMYDVVGQAVVPLTTRDGFEIGVNGAGELTIGAGRLYVDGILVECFGDMSVTERDDHLGGVRGRDPVGFGKQPSFYQPNFPGLLAAQGAIKLVYLDVWQREVTVFEDEALREPALNGPDTATRVQTAWQVKVMKEPANEASCATPPPKWQELIAASTARLSTQAAAVAPAAGPCIINPAGGYTGLENRLYRVEVHRAGTLGGTGGTTKAQFKWSRDNASLAAKVLKITTPSGKSTITVSSTGRDAWMRFEPGDHIELLDDDVELAMRETGMGGPMAKVLTVNHAAGEILVDQDLSGFPVVADRHPRIRRWDIATAAEALWRDVNNGVAIPLEEGISITFGGGDSATLHAGDYWVFAARTADGSIETLVDATPRGILHHYARLALVTSGTPPKVLSDCRHFWPAGCCCCTIEVGDGFTSHGEFNDIAQALDVAAHRVSSLTPIRICVLPGVHFLTETVVICRARVTIFGCGPASRVVAPSNPNGPAFSIVGIPGDSSSENSGASVRLESLFLAADNGTEPIIECTDSAYTTIQGNRIEHYGRGPLVRAAGCRYLSIVDNFMRGVEGLQVQGEALLIERNFLSRVNDYGLGFPGAPVPEPAQRGLIDLLAGTKRSRVIANRLERGDGHGITLRRDTGGDLTDVLIADNHVSSMRGSGIASLLSSGTAPIYIYGLRIEHNTIERCVTELAWNSDAGVPLGGIVVRGVEHLVIADNHIVNNGVQRPPSVPLAGIYAGHAKGLIVRDNVVTGNGRQGEPVNRLIEGGIVALDLVAPTALTFTIDDDFTVDPSQDASMLRPINEPARPLSLPAPPLDDWPAAMVHGNLVVSQARALTLIGLGPMQVTDNRLVSRDLFPILGQGGAGHTGTVLIEASGFSGGGGFFIPTEPDLQVNNLRLATGGVPRLPSPGVGNVIFSDNDIVLDRARPWQEPSQMGWAGSVAQISASDDLAFHDNVIRCTAGSQNLQANTYLSAFTTRATGNGVFEDGLAAFFLSLLLTVQGSGRYTVTDNQTTHCILISGGERGLNINNLEGSFCQAFTQTINLREAMTEIQESRLATLARIADLTRSEEEALREQKTELARTGGADDLRMQELEARIRGAESLRVSIELDLRMSDRAKEIQRGDWTLMGLVLHSDGRPIAGARLELQEGGKLLIEARADERGEIFAHFPESGYKDVFERAPQLKAILKTADGTVLQTLKQTLTPAANRVETFELRIDKALTPGKPAGSELQPPQVPDAGIGESKEEAVPEIQEPADVLKAAQAAPRKRSRKKASASEEEPTPKPGLETGQASAPRARKQRPRRSKPRPKPRKGE